MTPMDYAGKDLLMKDLIKDLTLIKFKINTGTIYFIVYHF